MDYKMVVGLVYLRNIWSYAYEQSSSPLNLEYFDMFSWTLTFLFYYLLVHVHHRETQQSDCCLCGYLFLYNCFLNSTDFCILHFGWGLSCCRFFTFLNVVIVLSLVLEDPHACSLHSSPLFPLSSLNTQCFQLELDTVPHFKMQYAFPALLYTSLLHSLYFSGLVFNV